MRAADNRARKAAVDAVRAVSADKSRDQVRALLERELGERDLSIDPLMVERQVEMILAERQLFGRTRFILRTFKQVKDSHAFRGGGILDHASGTSDEPWESRDEPDWLKLPDQAAYPAWSPGPKWERVEVDDAARGWLDRIKESDPKRLSGTRELHVWLAWNTDRPHASDSRLAVHIGAERVGILRADAAGQFHRVMEAAAERDQNPWMRGRLSAISASMPYLLEIELPRLRDG
jgi:hypothetical protein